ncbi:MAG: hypothetical protein ACFFAU_08680 [Candidatus Hodarchaeota archaeon]
MTLNDILTEGSDKLTYKVKSIKEFNELKRLLNLDNQVSEHELIATCRILKHMQNELDLSTQTPIRELVSLYHKLEDIRAVFDLHTNNFTQLNELLIEITTVREMADIPEDKPLTDLLFLLRGKSLASFGLRENSLLEKLLRYYIGN